MTVYAWHQECYDAAARHNKFYRAYLVGATVAYQYGPRGSLGQLATTYARYGTVSDQVRRKEQRGYRTLVADRPLDLPETLNVNVPGALEVLDAAFQSAWQRDWADALANLPTVDTSGARFVAALPGWAPLKKTWRGQDTTQPWGPRLAETLSGCPRVDDRDKDLTLIVVGAHVADWLRRHYTPPDERRRVQVLPARDRDRVDVLRTALQLWQPAINGPLAQLPAALDAARAVVG